MEKLTFLYTFVCLKLSMCFTSTNYDTLLFYSASLQKRLRSGENAIRVIMAAGQTLLANSNDLAKAQNAHMDG